MKHHRFPRCSAGPLVAGLLWVALGGSIVGCSEVSEALDDAAQPNVPVTLEVVDGKALQDVLERYRGEAVLVDYWATWCQPCTELFPHTVKLHEQYAGRGLRVISVSLDDPDDDRQKVLRFLAENGATFDNFISRHGLGTQSVEAFALDGPLPQYKLYDRRGRLYRSLGGNDTSLDSDQIDRAVEALLGET